MKIRKLLIFLLIILFLPVYRIYGGDEFETTINLLLKGNDHERQYAAEFLGKLKMKKAIPYLKDAVVKDNNWLVRLASVSSLYKLGEPPDEGIIEMCLQSENKYVRLKAAQILQGLSVWKDKNIILTLLDDKDIEVRKNIVIAAGKLKVKEALLPLITMLKDSIPDARESAAIALGSLGDRTALKPLLGVLEDPVPKVVRAAVISLGEIGDEDITMPMIRMLNHKDKSVRYFAVTILGELGDKKGFKAILGLVKDGDPKVRLGVLTILGNMKIKEYIPIFKEALNEDTDPYVKLESAKGLALMGDYSGYDLIKDEVFNKNTDLKRGAIETLGIIKDIKSQSIIKDLVLHPNPEIKEIAVWALGEIRGDGTFEFLLKKLKEERESKGVFIDALRKFKDKRLPPYLENYLEDKNFLVRKRAAIALSDFPCSNPVTEKKLINLLSDEYPEVRQAALIALVKCKGKIEPELLNIAKDNSDSLQMMAIAGLVELGDKDVIPVIVSLYQEEKYPRHKLLLAFQLASVGDYRGKDLIFEMAKSEDYLLRKQSAEYLSKFTPYENVSNYRDSTNSNFTTGSNGHFLTGFTDTDIFPVLANLINDKKKEVKLAATRSLGQIYDMGAINILLNNLVSENLYLEAEIENSLIQLQNISVEPLINIFQGKKFLAKENAAYIERAGSILVKIGLPAVDKLIKTYEVQDTNIKIYVMNILAKIGKDSIKPLVNYWDGKFTQSNTILVDTIMKISMEETKVLVDLLEDGILQGKAAKLIVRLTPDKIMDLLIDKLYASGGMVRIKVVECLRGIGAAASDRLIEDLFKSEDETKLIIIEVLGEIGHDVAIKPLEKLAAETDNIKIKEIGDKVINNLKNLSIARTKIGGDKSELDKLKKRRGKISMIEKNYIFTNLGWQDGINSGMVFQIFDNNNKIINKLQITEVVGNNISIGKLLSDAKVDVDYVIEEEVRESEVKEGAVGEIEMQLERLKSGDSQVRINAISILGEKGDETILPQIIYFMEDKSVTKNSGNLSDEEQMSRINVRKSAAWAIGEIEYRLISKIYQDSGEKKSLADEKKEQLNNVTNILINLFSDTDSGVRLAAVRNITRLIPLRDAFGLKNDFTLNPLCKLLNDPDNYTQRATVEALAELKDSRAIPFLVGVWDDDDATVRGNVGWALEKIGKEAVPSLRDALKDKSDEKKRSAASVLYKLGYKVKRTGNNYEVVE